MACLQFQEQCKIFSIKGCAIPPVGAIVRSLYTDRNSIGCMEVSSLLAADQYRRKKSDGVCGEEEAIDGALEAVVESAASMHWIPSQEQYVMDSNVVIVIFGLALSKQDATAQPIDDMNMNSASSKR
ncbi:hypothetical protein D5086_023980 [Populus alba]|uniref:Uncharacterized protein n=1 Tax=Populus alba TaxID=43335 RepID=A0ACC4B5Q4_POPAL